jgi:hypothetical protein
MTQFVAPDPGVEMRGSAMMAYVSGMIGDIRPILAKHHLTTVLPDDWYPIQLSLDILKTIAGDRNSTANLVSIGMKIPDEAEFPPEINSVETALLALDTAYHMNHRNGEIGHYRAEIVGHHNITLVCDNPYPCDFDYGIIYSLVRRFRVPGTRFRVYHDDSTPCRKNGGESCTYHVTWG